ncbi:Protein trichome birefringence-like 2 [Linum perenne]
MVDEAMDAKKLGLPDQIHHSATKKLLSGFTLWIATAFFLVLSVLILSSSTKGRVIFQGFNRIGVNSSLDSSWPFSLPASYYPNSGGGNASAAAFGVVLGKVGNSSEDGKPSVRQNASETEKSVNLNDSAGFGSNGSHLFTNGSLPMDKPLKPVSSEISVEANLTNAGELITTGKEKEANLSEIAEPMQAEKQSKEVSYEECDLFDGRWEWDESKPYYPAGSCPHIDRDFNCHANGRPDSGFVKWRWQANRCNIPRLNATDFLERLRGKKLVFVGDSLNRNMWESLVCILRHSIKNKKRVYEISGRREFKKKGVYAFMFAATRLVLCLQDYNCTVDFVASPFLVRESSFSGANGTFETLRLDLMDKTTSMYHDADIIVFNTGHWWTHEKTSKGEDYYQEGNHLHARLKVLDAYRRALKTWARWVDRSIDRSRTHVFFRGYSVTHFKGGQWNSGGQCHKETEPIFNNSYLSKYPSKMKVLENVLQGMKTPVTYLNISRLTDHRKDGHPSIYRMKYKTSAARLAAERSQDCSHWCLPGVPDTWNELLYASFIKSGISSLNK